jgi:hypothetical protein
MPVFEALARAFDCFNTDGFFSENSSKFLMHHFASLPLQEGEIDRISLIAQIRS